MGLFGPSQNEVWSQIARDIGGEHIESGFWQEGSLRYRHSGWEILLDTYTETHSSGESTTSSTYTRMRSPYISRRNFSFKLYREGFFSGIGKLFGGQDIEIGDAFFDSEFIIKSNQPETVTQLLSNAELKRLIQQQPNIHLEIKDNDGFWQNRLPVGTRELYFRCDGVIKETRLLKSLFELFCQTLDQLVEVGVAAADPPNVRLK